MNGDDDDADSDDIIMTIKCNTLTTLYYYFI